MANAHNVVINWPICPITNRSLDRLIVEERLTAYETWRTFNDCMQGDFESIAYMISEGCVGFSDYADNDLLAEWIGSEQGFIDMWNSLDIPFDLLEHDPLRQEEQQVEIINE